jgi:PAS domain-containing protein
MPDNMENSIDNLLKEIEGLKEMIRFYESILDKAPCFLYINEIGKTGEELSWKNIYLNRYALESTGYTREEVDA